ncbi:MAG: hypothetical protein NT123_23275 [Proteobacteria bacterium]|nr:hypothetical protein [Pseudomonadota bacterium]
MKHFDPSSGWETPSIIPIADHLARTRQSKPGADAGTGERISDSRTGEGGPGANSVFHFNRTGKMLRIKRIDAAERGGAADGGLSGIETESAPGPEMPDPLDLISFSTAIKEMFSTLSNSGEESSELNDVVESMRNLSVKLDERNRLRRILHDLNEEILLIKQVLNERVLAAHESEKKALTTTKIRVDLMQEIVKSIVASGEESGMK